MPLEECYCQILGINPYKENEYDERKLDGIIKKASDRWAKESTNIDDNVRLTASKRIEMQSDIADAMLEPESRRKEFEEGRRRLKSKLMPLLKKCIIMEDGRIYAFPKAVNDQLAKIGWDGITSEDVPEILDLQEGRPESPISSNVSSSFNYIQNVKASTPAEALNSLIANPKLKIQCHRLTDTSGVSSVKGAMAECYTRLGFVKLTDFPEQNTYIECLRKLKALSDDELESLIKYSRCYRDLMPAMDALMGECAYITRDQIDGLLPSTIDPDMAIPILESFCYKKSIGANFSKKESSLVRCPFCLSLLKGGDDAMVCPNCGMAIRAKCPRCKKVQDCTNKVCISCGFDFVKDTERARRLAVSFRTNLKKGNVRAARADLAAIKDSYSENIKVETLEYELQRCSEDLDQYSTAATKAYKNGRYYAALRAFNDLSKKYPEVLPNNPELDTMRRSAEDCFELAQESCLAANKTTDKKEKLDLYIKAAEHCMDHPAARLFLRDYPPQSVTDCEAVATKAGTIMIKFTPPADSKGVSYCIYRGTEIPAPTEDTDPFEVISKHKAETGYEDKTVESGVKYHYILCSRRWGVLSRPMQHIGPVVAFENVKKVSLDSTEEGFHISFERPPRAYAVRISRCLKGDEENCTDIDVGDKNECDDFCLVGNVYIYYFWTEYKVGNVIESSA